MKLILLLIALFNVPNALTKMISIDRVEIDIDPNYLKVKSDLEKVGGINVANLDLEVIKEESDITYQAIVYRHNMDHYEHFYKSDVISGCSHDEIKDHVLNFIFKESNKYGNLTASCPLKVGHYHLHQFKIDAADLPHELPAGKYRFDFMASVPKDGAPHMVYADKYYFTSE